MLHLKIKRFLQDRNGQAVQIIEDAFTFPLASTKNMDALNLMPFANF